MRDDGRENRVEVPAMAKGAELPTSQSFAVRN